MDYFDFSYPAPEENLACDEALLNMCEEGYSNGILRFWEAGRYFAVLGYSNKFRTEVRLENCRRDNIPVLRRTSGGGTVLQGPGCLNYSLILPCLGDHPLGNLSETNCYILGKHREALQTLTKEELLVSGISDLTIGGMKISGNAQRRKMKFLLFHGTFLYRFDLAKIEDYLAMPERQPDYRENRSHTAFLRNFSASPEAMKTAIKRIWHAEKILEKIPEDSIAKLVSEKYSDPAWNLKF